MHVSNITDPRLPEAMLRCDWPEHEAWLKGHVIGPPLATESHSVEELERMGMVGVYRE